MPHPTPRFASVAIGTDGTIWGSRPDGQVRRRIGHTLWEPVPGRAIRQLSVADARNVWGTSLGRHGVLCRWLVDEHAWQELRGPKTTSTYVSVGADGTAFSISPNGDIWRLDPPDFAPRKTPGLASSSDACNPFLHEVPVQVAAVHRDAAWAVSNLGNVYQFSAAGWTRVDDAPPLAWIGAAADGSVWGTNAAGALFRRASQPLWWEPMPGRLAQVVVASAELVLGLDSDGLPRTMRWDPQTWRPVPGGLSWLAAAQDGSGEVVGINLDGDVCRWTGAAWEPLNNPVCLVQIVATSARDLHGLDRQGRVFHFDGQRWCQVPQAAADRGPAWCPATDEAAAALPSIRGELPSPAPLKQAVLAGADRGAAWALDGAGNVFRAGGPVWEPLVGATAAAWGAADEPRPPLARRDSAGCPDRRAASRRGVPGSHPFRRAADAWWSAAAGAAR